MALALTETLLSKAAGWEAMKRARLYLEQDQVLSSAWNDPLLKGVVQAGESSFRAGLVIKGPIDIENLCTCRESREWGKICAHSVAIGLHWLRTPDPQRPRAGSQAGGTPGSTPSGRPGSAARSSAAGSAAPRLSCVRRDPTSGEKAELCLIFPPNLGLAAERGKVTLVVEARWAGGRVPLNALPKDRAYAFPEPDRAALDLLEELAGGETPAVLQIERPALGRLLPLLVGHPNLSLGKTAPLVITGDPWPLPVRATLEGSGEILLALRGVVPRPAWLAEGWIWREQARTVQPLGFPARMGDLFQAPVRVTRLQVPQFLGEQWPQLEAAGGTEANFKLSDFTLEPQPPRFLLELKGGLAQLTARLQCAYGSRIMTLGVTAGSEGVWLPDPAIPTRYSTRDTGAERAALARLQRQGFTGPDGQGELRLVGQNAVFSFFARGFQSLQRDWTVTLEERLERSASQNLERIEPQFQVTSSGVQWFDLGVVFTSTGGERFSAADIQRLLLSGQPHARLRNGKTALLDTGAVEELQEVLLDCSPQQHGDGYRIGSAQAGFLEATLRQQPGWKVQAPSAWRDRASRQAGEVKMDCPPLGDLDPVLRPYQKAGVGWLRFLRENGFGGVLADEMGLGKTLQTLALLRSLRADAKPDGASHPATPATPAGAGGRTVPLPHLVVCPTSLVFNWVAEAAKFTPELKVLGLHGPGRHALFEQVPQSDLVITSYALIRRDAERYRGQEFDTVILDEAQHIKNRQTQNAQAVKAVRSQHRLVLTGTPMENSVLDLWSVFDFLMPGYLGAAADFRERYELPIARDRNPDAQSRLTRRLRPFILRRLKKDVAADLPAKIEQISYCELSPEQRTVYQQVIEASRNEVLSAVGANGFARSRMVVLNALLRLRQVCCDLRLLKLHSPTPPPSAPGPHTEASAFAAAPAPSSDAAPVAPSGKLELFGELLEEIVDGGHRVLVFSQFVSMLTLLKGRLAEEGLEYCYLDGSTTDRGAVVERFQKSPGIPVFLISLKAGGVGLNLTGADTVVHFDPWWNPAVEDQATDRAHRLGQTRVVTSYKLIAKDTVEEKILMLQKRKREIIKATLGSEEELTEALSWEDVQELLSS